MCSFAQVTTPFKKYSSLEIDVQISTIFRSSLQTKTVVESYYLQRIFCFITAHTHFMIAEMQVLLKTA